MTPAEIDALPAGRELDALVAEKVMGCRVEMAGISGKEPHCGCTPTAYGLCSLRYPHGTLSPDFYDKCWIGEQCVKPYSTDIAAAWEVVEKLCRMVDGMGSSKPLALDFRHGGQWWCRVNTCEACVDVEADTAPLAICRAALKAMS